MYRFNGKATSNIVGYFAAPQNVGEEGKDSAEKNSVELLDYPTKGMFLNHSDYYQICIHLWNVDAR